MIPPVTMTFCYKGIIRFNFLPKTYHIDFKFGPQGRDMYIETVDNIENHFGPENDTLCNIKNQKLSL